MLEYLKDYFEVGTIFYTGKNVGYRVGSVKDLISVIIPHFNQYPLLSKKVCTFTLWSKAINMIYSGDHKTKKGFLEILSIYASINRGISTTVQTHFPSLKPAVLPSYSLSISPNELSEWWISGYFTIYCNFNVKMDPQGLRNFYYDRVVPSFNFSRSIDELSIISLLASYFEATVHQRSDGSRADVNIYIFWWGLLLHNIWLKVIFIFIILCILGSFSWFTWELSSKQALLWGGLHV